MNRLLYPVVILLLMCSAYTKAQTFRLGMYGGVNMTDVAGADLTDADNDFHKFGFNTGLLINTHLGARNIMQMEIGYSQTGSQVPPDTTNNNNYYLLRFNYVNVTLAFRHRINLVLSKNPTNRFDIEGGFSAGYLFNAYYEVKSIVYYSTKDGINLLGSNFNGTDVSLFVGATYNFSQHFCMDLRYYNSVTSVIPHDVAVNLAYPYYSSWNAGHNLVFQIAFRYFFGKDQYFDNLSQPVPPSTSSTPNQ